jgi:hypothetical protein
MNFFLHFGSLFREAFPPYPVATFWLHHNLRPSVKRRKRKRK